jgi:predicted phosphodiesterase
MKTSARRIAVLSDIHGVLPALESVLAEPEVTSADRIVLTGDLAAGPQPRETLNLLASLGDQALCIRGNADRELVQLAHGEVGTVPDPIAPWAAAQLRADQVELLAGLPLTATLEVAGLGTVLFCHATPRDDEEVVLADSRLERWADVLGSVAPEVTTVVCGHTHMPFCRLAHGRLMVNPGSVGMPYGRPGAHWALLGPGVQLRRTVFDAGTACARVAAESSYPDAAEWADFYLNARATDAEALAVMAPRDGRTGSDGRPA